LTISTIMTFAMTITNLTGSITSTSLTQQRRDQQS
jgi:hypothetical protein